MINARRSALDGVTEESAAGVAALVRAADPRSGWTCGSRSTPTGAARLRRRRRPEDGDDQGVGRPGADGNGAALELLFAWAQDRARRACRRGRVGCSSSPTRRPSSSARCLPQQGYASSARRTRWSAGWRASSCRPRGPTVWSPRAFAVGTPRRCSPPGRGIRRPLGLRAEDIRVVARPEPGRG